MSDKPGDVVELPVVAEDEAAEGNHRQPREEQQPSPRRECAVSEHSHGGSAIAPPGLPPDL